MRYITVFFILLLSLDAIEYKNSLQYESSPYLLQHQSNPIEWMPWSDEAFKRAKKEHKQIFVSIGYSTCHWCHEMAKQSFENKKIAKLFNKDFICIKVDREELPHIDSYYQELFLNIKGHYGGWPLSIFLSEDKEPIHMAGYIKEFDKLLPSLVSKYKSKTYKILTTNKVNLKSDANVSLKSIASSLKDEYDEFNGGFGMGRKFPEFHKLWMVLNLAQKLDDEQLLKYFYETLSIMATRGINDQVDGGFFRYSVDEYWRIPHFEKMLYNQAELIPIYAKAYELSGNELYKKVVIKTIDMVQTRFSENELFYSASDADTNHEEGAYFTFMYEEILASLKDDANKKEIIKAFKIKPNGNFEDKTHLNLYEINSNISLDNFINNLKNIRKTKEYPFVDKKIITSWNAMMIEALFSAGDIDAMNIKLANKHLKRLTDMMFFKGELYHQSLIGMKPTQKGLLEDYAFFISALLAGYEIDKDEKKLDFVVYLLAKAKYKFYRNGIWYLNDDEFRVKADENNKYYTSALSKMLQNIIKLDLVKNR